MSAQGRPDLEPELFEAVSRWLRLECPAVVVYGEDDALVAPSVAIHRSAIEDLGFSVHALRSLDHTTCLEAVDDVLAVICQCLHLPLTTQ